MAENSPLLAFAERHRLRTKRDEDGTRIIPGRLGHLWEDGDCMAMTVFGPGTTPGKWNNRRRACEAVGMELVQDGDAEGTLKFDPSNVEQARAAIRAVGAFRQRRLSDERRRRLAEAGRQFQFTPA